MAFPQAGLKILVQGMGQFVADLKSAGHAVTGFVGSIEKSAGSLNIFSSIAERAGREFTIFMRALTYYAIYQVIGAVEQLTVSIFEQVAAYELLESSLQAMTARDLVRAGTFKTVNDALADGGAVAKELIVWMEELDVASRFDLATIQSVYQLGSTYGFVREQMQPLEGIVLDWASATGRGTGDMIGAIRALGQVYQKQKFLLLESNQLAEHGVPAIEYLARSYGTTTDQIRKMISDGLIPANTALQIITDGMATDYAGATARFSQTITGLTTSLQDLIRIDLREFGLGISEGVLPYVALLVTELNDPNLRAGFHEIGRQLGESIGNFFAWSVAILSTEDPLRTLAYLIDQALPGFGRLFDTLVQVAPVFFELAAAAFEWGFAIVSSLAEGMIAAASEVLDALAWIAEQITYWLSPGSPPKILPELTIWGQEWIESLTEGFKFADLSALTDLQGVMRTAFENLIPTGQMSDEGVIPALLGTTEGVSRAITDIKTLGNVSSETLAQISQAAGPAAEDILELISNYETWYDASLALAEAQSELDRVVAAFSAKLDPLKARQDELEELEEVAAEEKDLAKWRKIAGSSAYSDAKRAQALREIEKIQLAQQIRQIEKERDVAVSSAGAKVDAAKIAEDTAKSEFDAAKARIAFQKEQNDLVREQIALLQKLQQELGTKPGKSEAERQREREKKAAEDAAEAEFKLALAKADTAGKIDLYRQKLESLQPGTKEYFDTQREIVLLEQKLAQEQDRTRDAIARGMEETRREALQVRDAQLEAELAGKSHEERLKILQDRLAELTPGTKEYYDMLKRVRQEAAALEKEQEAAAKKAAGGGKGAGGGAGGAGGGGAFKPSWGGLDLEGIKDKAEGARKKIAEIGEAIDSLGKTVSTVQEKLTPFKEFFVGLGAVLGGSVLVSLGLWVARIVAAAAPVFALAGAIGFLKFAWETNFGGMASMWMDIWDGLLKPSFDLLGEALGMWLPDDVKTLGDAWTKVLKPALLGVWQFIVDYIMPVLGVLAAGLIITLAGAIAGTRLVWEGFHGALKVVYNWWVGTAVPWLKGWQKWFAVDLPFAVEKFNSDFNIYILIPLQEWLDWLDSTFDRGMKWLIKLFAVDIPQAYKDFNADATEFIYTPFKRFGDWMDTVFFGTLGTLQIWFKTRIAGAIKDLRDNYVNPLIDKWEAVKDAIGFVLDKARELVDFVTGIYLPTIDINVDWPDPPDWWCDTFGCSPKPPPLHQKAFIDVVYSRPVYEDQYRSPMTSTQAMTASQLIANSYAVTNNYNYSPKYGGAPRNEPRRNFDIMRTWGL